MRMVIGMMVACLLLTSNIQSVSAQATEDELDGVNKGIEDKILEELQLEELDDFTENYMPDKMSFSELVEEVMQDGISGKDAGKICEYVYELVFYEVDIAKDMMFQVLLYVAIFTLFGNMIHSKERYISEMSFLMVYAAMMVVLLQTFSVISETVKAGIEKIIAFLAAMIPAYATALVFSGNASTGAFFYEFTFGIIYVLEWMLQTVLAPGIHLLLLLQFIDYVFEENRFSKLAELIEKFICFVLKVSVSSVVGIGVIQSLIAPAKDRVSGSLILQSVTGIPGIGKITGSAGEILLGCGILIKNSVGVAAIIILFVVALSPMLKVLIMQAMYKILAAILQPVADKRIIGAISGVGKAGELYFKLLFNSVLLFFITIAVISATTSFIY